MKNPVLMVGVLFMAIFLMNLGRTGKFFDRSEKLKATSCRAVLVKLDRRIPANWKTQCLDNNLTITINDDDKFKNIKQPEMMAAAHFRELANHLSYIAKNSPEDNLERVGLIIVKYITKQKIISALTEGRFLARLNTLQDIKLIADHLKATVKIKEETK